MNSEDFGIIMQEINAAGNSQTDPDSSRQQEIEV